MLPASPRVSNGKMPSPPQLRGVTSFKTEICKMSLTVRGACWRSVSWGWCFGRASQRTLPVQSMCWCLSEKQMAFQVRHSNVTAQRGVSFYWGLGRSVTRSIWDSSFHARKPADQLLLTAQGEPQKRLPPQETHYLPSSPDRDLHSDRRALQETAC